MPEKNTRGPKAAAAVKPRTAKAIAASAATSSRVSAPAAKAVTEAAAAASAPRKPKPAEAATAKAVLGLQASAPAPARAALAVAPVPVAAVLQSGADQARDAFARVKATTETMRQAASESATATSRGVIEVNEKLIDAMRAQSDAAFELWRSALSATSVSEAIRIQTTGARQVYETAASQWKDIAETTGRWLAASVKPIQSAWTPPGR